MSGGGETVRSLVLGSAAGRCLGAMAFVDAIGTGLYLAASALFFTRIVGLSGAQFAFGLMLAGVIGLLATVPIGTLADRVGPRLMLIALSLWRAAGFAAYAWVDDFTRFLIVVCLLGVADRAASPILQALVSSAVGDRNRVTVMAVVRAVRNIGFIIGAALASLAIAANTRQAYLAAILANAASFVFVAMMVALAPLRSAQPTPAAPPAGESALRAVFSSRYVIVSLLNAGLSIHMTLLAVGMPLWVSQHSAAPAPLISLLIVVNAVIAVLFQVRASRDADTVQGAAWAQFQAGIALAASCVLFALAPGLPLIMAVVVLVIAVLALTAGELFQSAGGWGLSYSLAAPGRQGACLALFSLGPSLQQIVAPPLVAGPVIGAGPLGWVVLGAASFVCGAGSLVAARWPQVHSDHVASGQWPAGKESR